MLSILFLFGCAEKERSQTSTFWKIDALWSEYRTGSPEEAVLALDKVIQSVENEDDGSIRGDVVLELAFLRKHLVYDFLRDVNASRQAIKKAYDNRRAKAMDDSLLVFYYRMYYSVAMLDNGLIWVNSEILDCLNVYMENRAREALAALEKSITLLNKNPGLHVQREFLLPLQYFRKYHILNHLGESERAQDALRESIISYRMQDGGRLSDDEIYELLFHTTSHFDAHVRWVSEPE